MDKHEGCAGLLGATSSRARAGLGHHGPRAVGATLTGEVRRRRAGAAARVAVRSRGTHHCARVQSLASQHARSGKGAEEGGEKEGDALARASSSVARARRRSRYLRARRANSARSASPPRTEATTIPAMAPLLRPSLPLLSLLLAADSAGAEGRETDDVVEGIEDVELSVNESLSDRDELEREGNGVLVVGMGA